MSIHPAFADLLHGFLNHSAAIEPVAQGSI